MCDREGDADAVVTGGPMFPLVHSPTARSLTGVT